MTTSIHDQMIPRDDLATMDFSDVATDAVAERPTPGDVLLEEFMKPARLSAYALAKAIGVPANRVTNIINGHRAITADTAIRLSAYFGTSAEMWMNLQMAFDLSVAREARRA